MNQLPCKNFVMADGSNEVDVGSKLQTARRGSPSDDSRGSAQSNTSQHEGGCDSSCQQNTRRSSPARVSVQHLYYPSLRRDLPPDHPRNLPRHGGRKMLFEGVPAVRLARDDRDDVGVRVEGGEEVDSLCREAQNLWFPRCTVSGLVRVLRLGSQGAIAV